MQMTILALVRPIDSCHELERLSQLSNGFATWLRDTRERRGLTTQALADKAGLTQPYVSMLEKKDRKPSRRAAAQLANALEVDPSEALLAAGFVPDDPHDLPPVIRRELTQDQEELLDAYEGLPDTVQESYLENILRVAREMRKNSPSKDDYGRRSDADDNPTQLPS